MLETILSSFTVVALSEMGDKTQLLAFSLVARFKKPFPVLVGIFVATILNHLLAASVGAWVAAQVSPRTIAGVLAAVFIAFGFWTLKPDTLDDDEKKDGKWGAFVTTTFLFFLVEMGDKTQLATVALAAKYGNIIWVTFGTTLGMMFSDGIAVFLGHRFAHHVQHPWIRISAAMLFFGFGVASLVSALS
ncbi:TMEM165/GDT1 family protein [Bdellovibrionota bacterium FG-2]